MEGDEALDHFRFLIESIPMISWTADAAGTVDYISPQFHAFTGADPADPGALDWSRWIHPEDLSGLQAEWRRCVREGEVLAREFRIQRTDGESRWFWGRAIPRRSPAGEVIRWYGCTSDITSHKAAQEKISKVADSKDAFIAMLGHELRNPLATVAMGIDLLAENPAGEERDEALALIRRQTDILRQLIDETLDLSRLETGLIDVEREPVDLASLARQVADDLRPFFGDRGVELRIEVNGDPAWVDGDHLRLSQCVTNLLGNALKFTPRGGTVSIRCSPTPDECRVVVEDSGIGIEKEAFATLFKPFQLDSAGGPMGKQGLGLGLTLVKRIVDLHGGTIRAESDGRDRGSRFVLAIPSGAPPRDDEAAGEAEAPGSAKRGQPRRDVLIVEDNPSVARVLEMFFDLEGHEVRLARDSDEAMEQVSKRIPDIIFSDISLEEGLSGWELAGQLRSKIPEAEQPHLVALSGHVSAKDVERSLEAGFDEHLAKPPDPETLRRCLSGLNQ